MRNQRNCGNYTTNPEFTTASLAIMRETYIARKIVASTKISELEDVKLNLKEASAARAEEVTDQLSNQLNKLKLEIK